jgi:phosphoribosylformylglycinamidine cyclo-ligase
LAKYRIPEVFERIRKAANASDETMLRTFNLGVGLAIVCREADARTVIDHLIDAGEQAYEIGEIVPGSGQVRCS